MDTPQRRPMPADRVEMYRRSAAEALAEIDELQSEILAAQARVTTLMKRVRALENLVGAVHDLVGPSVELPIAMRPVRIEGLSAPLDEPLPQRRRERTRVHAADEPAYAPSTPAPTGSPVWMPSRSDAAAI